ncbi:hypothetical protein CVT26_011437 [Gymnopilus dilepis]|uniref:Uncharacterized protein n=1 Tax=Gymnopilus dilepis TaxID=231916 RepID=A0A409YQJ8_9AGAR|nr:hypothetical protein CVT26_011437 [Gymnopilus dilepis]
MANPVRPAKSSSEWTRNELLAFNIRVENANTEEFFNTAQLPATQVSETILNNVEMPDHPLPKDDRLFFRYLKRVHTSGPPESRVNDFAAFILRLLDYDGQDRIICQRPELLFPMAGQHVGTRSDLCVRDNNCYRLLVHEDKSAEVEIHRTVQLNHQSYSGSLVDPEPPLIAAAIAAFYQNNLHRRFAGKSELGAECIPAIVMAGSAPIFYRIPVTVALLDALVTGTYPAEETVVLHPWQQI